MKKLILPLILISALSFIAFIPNDDEPKRYNSRNTNPNEILIVDSKKFDGNNISTWYRTNGSFNRDPSTGGNGGFEWPKGSGKTARYASGIWLACVSGNDTLAAVAEYNYDFLPGYVDDDGNPQGANDPAYRIYKIVIDSTSSSDYLNWPANQGAYINSNGKPYLMGVQTMFFVYTDAYPHMSNQSSIRSLKAQIMQTNWAYNPFGYNLDSLSIPLKNTIFTEYRIINRSNEVWDNTWMGMWTDDDLGNASDDKVGCDTVLNLGFTYNATNHDDIYGSAPPAIGFKYLKGGQIYTGNPNDTIKYYSPFGSDNLILKIGFKDSGMGAFNYYNSTSPQPSEPMDSIETFRVMKGLWRTGQSWTNPVTSSVTTKVYSGDPLAGTGWLMAGGNDRRYIMSTGPSVVNPGDTLTIIAVQIIAKGNSNLNSVTQLKRGAQIVQNFFENNQKPQTAPISPKVSYYAPGDGKIHLTWNDSAEKFSFQNSLTKGTYKFQGYNIYQIKTYANPSINDTVLVKTFDINDGITNIADSVYLSEYGGVYYGIVQKGSDNGISRFITLSKDTISNKNFINGTEYKFAVTSYYYDPTGGILTYPKVYESAKSMSLVRIVPQNISAGTQISYKYGDTINTDQKDLAVMPIIVKPLELINATYISTFGKTGNDTTWTLTKTFNGITTTLFQNVPDFKGVQDSSKTIDGFLLVHQMVKDSGVVKDPNDPGYPYLVHPINTHSKVKAWTYTPSGNQWIQGPDTTAIRTAKLFTGKQFESRSIGMSFPTSFTFRSVKSRIFANASFIKRDTIGVPTFTGGPLRKIKIVFGQNQKAYRFGPTQGNVLLTDTNLSNTPFGGMVNVPFSVYFADELDSTGGIPRQTNVAFIDSDNDSLWNPDTTTLGKYQITYILTSTYDSIPNQMYTTKNPGTASPTSGFAAMDIMYVWVPRVINKNGVPATYTNGDVLTVNPYRPTRPDFVPGFPVKYSWTVSGTEFGNQSLAASEVNKINVFPNPYYGFSELEYNSSGDKFIYFSHLPPSCVIYIYTLDGVLINMINRNNTDPNNTLEKWDLKNQSGSFVASGMYVVFVDCKDLGAKTLKMAVFSSGY